MGQNAEYGDVVMTKSDDGNDLGYFNISEVSDAIRGLGNVSMSDVLPPLVGGTAAIAGTLLIKKFVTNATVVRFAPGIGAGIGVLASIPLVKWYGPQGVISGALSSAVAGGALMVMQELAPKLIGGNTGLINVQKMGAVVASGAGARTLPTARVPAGVGSAMNVSSFGGKTSY